MTDTPKVLIVEDDAQWQEHWRESLGDDVAVISATSIPQALSLFREHPNFDAIVMDACVPGDDINTIPLVREFRKTFSGPMLASSSSIDYRKDLIQAGCSHECRKNLIPQTLREILAQQGQTL